MGSKRCWMENISFGKIVTASMPGLKSLWCWIPVLQITNRFMVRYIWVGWPIWITIMGWIMSRSMPGRRMIPVCIFPCRQAWRSSPIIFCILSIPDSRRIRRYNLNRQYRILIWMRTWRSTISWMYRWFLTRRSEIFWKLRETEILRSLSIKTEIWICSGNIRLQKGIISLLWATWWIKNLYLLPGERFPGAVRLMRQCWISMRYIIWKRRLPNCYRQKNSLPMSRIPMKRSLRNREERFRWNVSWIWVITWPIR